MHTAQATCEVCCLGWLIDRNTSEGTKVNCPRCNCFYRVRKVRGFMNMAAYAVLERSKLGMG